MLRAARTDLFRAYILDPTLSFASPSTPLLFALRPFSPPSSATTMVPRQSLTIAILYGGSKTPRRLPSSPSSHLLSLSLFFISFRSKATRATYYLRIDDSQSWQQIEGGEANSARNRLSLLQRRRYHESRSTTNARDADAASLTLHCGQRYTNVLLFQKLPPLLSNR